MIVLLFSSLIIAMAAINRFRGGGVIPVSVFDPPGHRRFWATPLVMLAALCVHPPGVAVLLGLCWLIWALLPWGRWYTCGRGYREWSGPPGWFEHLIERTSARITGYSTEYCDGAIGILDEGLTARELQAAMLHPAGSARRILDDHLCLVLRNAIALTPLAMIAPLAALIVLVGMSVSYEAAWRALREDEGPTATAEWMTGMWWALAIIAVGPVSP